MIPDRDLAAFSNEYNMGLTKREYFAAAAMKGLLASGGWTSRDVADDAVDAADAVLARLAKES